MGHNVLKIAARAAAAKTYVDDVFSTYLYSGDTTTAGYGQPIQTGVALASTAVWSAYKLQQNNSYGRGIAVDSSGNVYITGYANDGTSNYIITAKYDSSGVLQWQRKLKQNTSNGYGIAVDSSGNVYVTGYANDGTNTYIITAKYNSSGTIQWQRKLQQISSSGFGIAVDGSSNVYITGYANDGTNDYIITAKYNSSGTLQWQRKLKQNNSYGQDIALDSSGNVFVTGYANDGTNTYIITAKYNSSGTIQWQRKLKQNDSYGRGIAVDSSGNVYITGYANDGTNNYTITAKYNSSGTLQWQRKLQQNNSEGIGIALDSSGNVFVTGYANDGTNNYIITAKYNNSGTLQWQRKLKQNNNSGGYGIALDSSGNVYVTGYASDGTNDYIVTLKLAQDGSTLSGTAFVTMTPGPALEAAGGATDSAGGATDSAGGATDSAGGATDSAGGATESSATQAAITGSGGMVWIKGRSAAADHILTDTVRGAGTSATASKALSSDLTSAESLGGTAYDYLSAFSAHGFNVTQGGTTAATQGTNYNGELYAAWTFRKAPKFFDVVTWTGNGTNRTIAHSLGQVPGMIVVKRTDVAADWQVYHRSLANTEYLVLNTTAAKATGTTRWNSTTATATDFSLGTDTTVNANSGTYVAYLFSHDTATDGLIQCGSYTGTNSATTKVNVTLGWEPQFILVKNVNNAGDWNLVDCLRGIVVDAANLSSIYLRLNLSNAEVNTTGNSALSPTATGFYALGGGNTLNAAATYIYIAIRRPNKPPTSGAQVFQPTVYTGTNVNNRLVNTTIAPDMVWVRQRNDTTVAGLVVGDRLRGQPYLLTGGTAAEVTSATALDQQIVSTTEYGTAFSSMSGFWVGTDATAKLNVNTTSNNHIAEAFKRAPGVFDVVAYTGTGTNTTQTHNLGVVPELILVKRRGTTGAWSIYSATLLNTEYLVLNTNAAKATGTTYWNSTTPTASAFSLGTAADVNASTANNTYVAYLFATVAGISKVGSYTGNGGTVNTNGTSQTINCGFSAGARFVLIKRTDSTGDWYVFDSARGIVASSDPYLLTNSTAAEVTTVDAVDADNSGFIVNQTSGTNLNVTNATYLYLAIS